MFTCIYVISGCCVLDATPSMIRGHVSSYSPHFRFHCSVYWQTPVYGVQIIPRWHCGCIKHWMPSFSLNLLQCFDPFSDVIIWTNVTKIWKQMSPQKNFFQQESIAVGCVPPVSWPYPMYIQGGLPTTDVDPPDADPPFMRSPRCRQPLSYDQWCMLGSQSTPCQQTNVSKNITFPQIRFREVKEEDWLVCPFLLSENSSQTYPECNWRQDKQVVIFFVLKNITKKSNRF